MTRCVHCFGITTARDLFTGTGNFLKFFPKPMNKLSVLDLFRCQTCNSPMAVAGNGKLCVSCKASHCPRCMHAVVTDHCNTCVNTSCYICFHNLTYPGLKMRECPGCDRWYCQFCEKWDRESNLYLCLNCMWNFKQEHEGGSMSNHNSSHSG